MTESFTASSSEDDSSSETDGTPTVATEDCPQRVPYERSQTQKVGNPGMDLNSGLAARMDMKKMQDAFKRR